MFKVLVLAVCIIAVFVVSWIGEIILHGSSFGFGSDGLGWADYVYVAGMTIAGVFISIVVTALKQLPSDRRISGADLLDLILRPPAMIALCVSPIVFYSAIISVGAQGSNFLSLFAALQNGFFWEQVLKTQESRSARPAAESVRS